MTQLFSNRFSNATANAQDNLCGRTHYVDPDTLRFHKSRVLATYVADNGLLFGILESVALDMDNTRRGFRYVVFDVFGTVLSRCDLDGCWKTREAARKAMWRFLDECDAKALTLAGIENAERNHAQEMAELRAKLTPVAAAA